MTFETIDYEVQGRVARIWHNRPAARNAENRQLLQEMDDALRLAAGDEAVRAIIIAGRGDHFSSGHDIREGARERPNPTVEQRWAYEEQYYLRYALNIWDCPKPTIAQVQGACIAGAFMVANLCDLIVASDDAFFADPVVPAFAASAVEILVHPWVLGLRKAKEVLFTGARFSAAEALAWGMVNKVVPRPELEEAAMALGERIAEASPFALKITKRSLNRTADIMGFRAAIEAHFDTHQLSHVTAEAAALKKPPEQRIGAVRATARPG
ncbi:MAG TPA: enoyl-CoA hydratase [Acetobacteraceae bacterium]|nr:enoyl-CoA hydratase [Acetobacteraceae bacterium]